MLLNTEIDSRTIPALFLPVVLHCKPLSTATYFLPVLLL